MLERARVFAVRRSLQWGRDHLIAEISLIFAIRLGDCGKSLFFNERIEKVGTTAGGASWGRLGFDARRRLRRQREVQVMEQDRLVGLRLPCSGASPSCARRWSAARPPASGGWPVSPRPLGASVPAPRLAAASSGSPHKQ